MSLCNKMEDEYSSGTEFKDDRLKKNWNNANGKPSRILKPKCGRQIMALNDTAGTSTPTICKKKRKLTVRSFLQNKRNGFADGEAEDKEGDVTRSCEDDEKGNIGGALNEFGGEDGPLMSFSGNFPHSQNDDNNVDPASDLDDISSTLNSSGPIGPQVTKLRGRVIHLEDESYSELDIRSDEDQETSSHRYGRDLSKQHSLEKEFVDEEAELSGSGASSDEDEDSGDDIFEEESGDQDELLSEEELHDQVVNIHRKMMLDKEENHLIFLKEKFVHSDDEDDGQWRKERHEREKWLEKQERLVELKEMEKSASQQIIPDAEDTILPKSGTSDLPESPQKLSTVVKRSQS